ncbi:MAG: LAGLIDADG family homing endonuclease [Candidatus Aenigmatarchaeota archaeon]
MEEHIFKLRKLINELDKIRGRHTELVSVYVPAEHNLQEIVNMLKQEYTLTDNVKNKTVRNNVLGAIDKILQELRFYKKTPPNGLVLFSGNVSENEGQTDIKVWTIEPPEPMRIKKYWCDQKFELAPLQDMVEEKELYGLIVLDNREATIGLLKGKKILMLRQVDSIVPGKTIKGGQCLSPSTIAFCADGNLLKMNELKENMNVKAVDFNSYDIVDSSIVDFWEAKKSECCKIITKYPRIELESSMEHVFLVWENQKIVEKSAEALREGEFLLMPEKIDIDTNNSIDSNLAQLVGYFLGDGNFDKNRLVFSDGDKDVILHYKKIAEKLFNANVSLRYRESKGYYEAKVYSKEANECMRNNFFSEKSSVKSLIPSNILTSNDKTLGSFMRGIFDAEGSASISSDRIGFGINNKLLAQQIQLSLLRFGIISSFLEYDNRRNPYSKNHRFTLEISEKESLSLFGKLIGFTSKQKQESLKSIIKNKSDKSSVRKVFVSGKYVRKIIESYGLKKQDFKKVSGFFLNQRNMGKSAFKNSILSEIKDHKELYDKLKLLMGYKLLPVKIHKIEKYQKEMPMIDISVKNQNFIANGIFVHNSAQRFERVREGLIHDWYKIIGENVKKYFSKEMYELKGIILGGPGPAKNDFFDGDFISLAMKKEFLGTKNVGYTDEQGLEELVERSQDLLAEASIAKEKALLQRFFEELRKDSGTATYGKDNIVKAMEMGAVETIIVTEEKDDIELTEKAMQFSTTVEVVSKDTREGSQLHEIGGMGAILRWKIS